MHGLDGLEDKKAYKNLKRNKRILESSLYAARPLNQPGGRKRAAQRAPPSSNKTDAVYIRIGLIDLLTV